MAGKLLRAENPSLRESRQLAGFVILVVFGFGALGCSSGGAGVEDLRAEPELGERSRIRWAPTPDAAAYRLEASDGTVSVVSAELCSDVGCSVGLDKQFLGQASQVSVSSIDEEGKVSEPAEITVQLGERVPEPAPRPLEVYVARTVTSDSGPGVVFERSPAADLADAQAQVARFGEEPDVVSVGINQAVELLEPALYSYDSQEQPVVDSAAWQHHALEFDKLPGNPPGNGVIVAVIDSNIETGHPSISANMLDKITLAQDPNPSGHGTMVTSLIVGTERGGTPGIAPGAKILPIEASAGGVASVQEAIYYAVDQDVDVINLSLSVQCVKIIVFSRCQDDLNNALQYAEDNGVVVVAGAGNDGRDGSPNSWPAISSTTISVGALDKDNRMADLSSDRPDVDVLVPGIGLLVASNQSGYDIKSGTSLSAPLVSGLVAVVLSENPDLTPADIHKLIRESVDSHNQIDITKLLELAAAETPGQESARVTTGELRGDPHLRTFDGYPYSFQAVGEYVLAKNSSLQIQARFEPFPRSTVASRTTAVAVSLGSATAMVDLEGGLWLDGAPVSSFPESVEGVSIEVNGGPETRGETVFTWPDETKVRVDWRGVQLAVKVESPGRHRWQGLLGDADGDSSNDLVGSDGVIVDQSFESLYRQLAPRWAVDDKTSILAYSEGETNGGFFDASFPSAVVSIDDFDDAAVGRARTLCIGAKVFFEPYLNDCIYDFLVTGDERTVEAASQAHQSSFIRKQIRVQAEPLHLAEENINAGGGIVYEVSGTPGSPFSVFVDSVAGVANCKRLAGFEIVAFDESGEVIAEPSQRITPCGALEPWKFPADGRMYVGVRSQDYSRLTPGVTAVSSYELTFASPQHVAETLDLKSDSTSIVSGRFVAAGEHASYRVKGSEKEKLVVVVDALDGVRGCQRAQLDIEFVVTDSAGETVAQEWPGNEGCKGFGPWAFPADGVLTVRVAAGKGKIASQAGSYELRIGKVSDTRQIVDLKPGSQKVTGAIKVPLDTDIYELNAAPGTKVSVEVASLNEEVGCGRAVWNLHIDVTVDGELVESRWPGNQGCGGSAMTLTVGESGKIELVLRGGGGRLSPGEQIYVGSYELALMAQPA